jgi:uncharacterized RDD family membrane protein YckC
MKNFDLDSQQFVGFFPRFFAALIDFIILYPLIFIERYFFLHRFPFWFLSIFIVISLSISYGYNPLFIGLIGWTPGKYLLRLRVINPQGKKIGLVKGLIRYIITFITILPATYYQFTLAGLLTANPSINNYPEAYKDIYSQHHLFSPTNSILMWLPYILFTLVDICFLIFNSRHRALHDFMAGSYVIKVKKEANESLQQARARSAGPGC